MKKLSIALQLYSVRNDMAADFEGTLKKVKAMGYEGVEFAGLFDRSATDIKKILDELDLVPVSAHVPFGEMISDPEKVLGIYTELGCTYVAIPYMIEENRPGKEGFSKSIESIRMLGKVAKEKGLILLYHNHDFEFVKVNGEYGLDVLYNSIPADLLQTEIDTCWVNVAGEKPVEYLKKYTGRAPVVHIKDFVMKGKERPAQLYNLNIYDLQPEQSANQEESFGFRPVGYGVQDVPAIVQAAKDVGAQWIVVEQDNPGPGKTPIESVEMSINYLKALKI